MIGGASSVDNDRGSRPSVTVLMSNTDDAHQRKIVRAFGRHRYPLSVCGFRRDDYYRGNEDENRDISILGVIGNEVYATRLPIYMASLRGLRRRFRDADMVVAFNAENVLLVRAATWPRKAPLIVRELADVPRAVDGPGSAGRLARSVERWGLKCSSGVLVTSPGYVAGYLKKMGYRGPASLLPNKPDLPAHPVPVWIPPADGKVTILYPGLIRCPRSLEILAQTVAQTPGVGVTVRGYDLTGSGTGEGGGLRFEGPYRSPEDLPSLYDREGLVVYSGYPYEPHRTNYALARTNRFYEAVAFGRPQICHLGTADADEVDEHALGIVIDPADTVGAARQIASVPVERWRYYADNARRMAREWSTFDEDFGVAIDRLWSAMLRSRG